MMILTNTIQLIISDRVWWNSNSASVSCPSCQNIFVCASDYDSDYDSDSDSVASENQPFRKSLSMKPIGYTNIANSLHNKPELIWC